MNNYCTIFCRESTEGQARSGLKMDVQEKYLKEKAKELKLDSVMVVRIAETGSKDQQRRKFYKMLTEMKQNELKILLAEKADRLMREKDTHLTAMLQRICTTYQLEKIVLPGDSKVYDAQKGWSADESLMMDLVGRVTAYKSDIISEEVTKALKEKAERGEPLDWPVGYKGVPRNKEKGTPPKVFKTEMAEKVKLFLEIFHDKQYSLSQMLRVARDIGLKSARGNPMKHREDVRRIIRSRYYYGEFEAYGKVRKIKTPGYEPLITKKMWEENQKILDARRLYRKPDNKLEFKFSQTLYCGECGRMLYAQQYKDRETTWKRKDGTVVKKRYSYQPRYVCTGREKKKAKCSYPSFWEDEIEDILYRKIGRIELNEGAWEKVKSRLFRDEERAFLESEILYLEKERTRNETKLDQLYQDCKDKKIISETYMSKRMQEIERRQEEIDEKLSELKDSLSGYHEKIGRAIEILDSLKNFRDKWEKANSEKKREMIKLLTIKITTHVEKPKIRGKEYIGKDLEIQWNNEVRELSELELIRRIEENKGGGGGNNSSFNGGEVKDGLSDIGGFSLSELYFEGIR